jgi:hypothetical protein
VTPRRRQGSGRAAVDHLARQLTDSLCELSRVQVSQAAMAVANDPARLDALLARLDLDALVAVTASAGLVHKAGQQQIAARRKTEGTSP